MNVSKKLRNFAESLVGNRVLDLYLKYIGVKTITSATLVPVALIAGKDAMEKFLNNRKQDGGATKLPVLDDPLIGNYLKLAGAATLNITMETLIPLGTLMLVYNLYTNHESQQGGAMNKHVKRVWGNRVLDLFLKYNGIKTLTSATLVPLALIKGKDMLEDVLKGKQRGGALIPKNMPIIDDKLLGNYLKLAGLSTVSLTFDTLVPLGLVAALYNIYENRK
tara:strand:- start:298 stop:960 length:663 start_codon:yes stop_codon:yes gene_type:complete